MAQAYPRTMTKGVFKGQQFESQADYLRAIKAYRAGQPLSTEAEHLNQVHVRYQFDDGGTLTLSGPATARTLSRVLNLLAEIESEEASRGA